MPQASKTVEDVKAFWNENPLWVGESQFEPGTLAFFEEHRHITIHDCLAGSFDERVLPPPHNRDTVLDLGCGIGFWTVEFSVRGCSNMTAADLTPAALALAEQRCKLYGINAQFSEQNAEAMTFADNTFSHVNCQGVIHHTPNTQACVAEIARILRPGGTASISVYYHNAALRAWPILRWFGLALSKLGAGLKGRNREHIYALNDVNEIVRLYDGGENPIGKAYTRQQFVAMLNPYFVVEETFLHFFPARTLPFSIPQKLHKLLDSRLGFILHARLTKR